MPANQYDHHDSGPNCYANALALLATADRDEPDSERHKHLLLEALTYAQLAAAAATVDAADATGALANRRDWNAATKDAGL